MKISCQYNLSVLNSSISKDWNFVKNFPLRPSNVAPNSNKKVWWKCKNGHEWMAYISTRNRQGTGCPYCSNHKISLDNCLAIKNNKLIGEWNYEKNKGLTPNDVFPNANKKVWWKCKEGHEWKASPNSRVSKKSNCPYCCHQLVTIDNSLLAKFPNIAQEWNKNKNGNLSPSDFNYGSNKKVWWICFKKHEWVSTISNRAAGKGCPYCHGKKINKSNCLASLRPYLLKEWDYDKNKDISPHMILYSGTNKVWWKCKKGHSWSSVVYSRTILHTGCPYCSNQKVSKDNNLLRINPNLSKEWNYLNNKPLTPDMVVANSHKKVWWSCSNGHRWEARVRDRNHGGGCPFCFKIKLKDGTYCDSLVEAFCYVRFKNSGERFLHNERYHGVKNNGLGRHRFDFYFPLTKTYIEVTGYSSKWSHWDNYLSNINKKRQYVENILKGKFKFIYKKLSKNNLAWLRQYIDG